VPTEAADEQLGTCPAALVNVPLPHPFGEQLLPALPDLISDHCCQSFLDADRLLRRLVPEEEGEQERSIGSAEFRPPSDILSMQGDSP
jgi:hypothetical protein